MLRLVSALLAVGVTAVSQASAPAGSIDDFIASEMPASGVPGLAFAVIDHGDITLAGARGVVEIGVDTTITPDTTFVTGSISKSFTALAVMQLVEAGQVELHTALSRYLDVFSGRPAGAITIRQLLSHTSGFSTFQGNRSHADRSAGADALARRVDAAATLIPAHPPGRTWEYSNVNFEILGRLVEVVSGQTFQTYIETHIMAPVGMAHSFVADGTRTAGATGHRPWFGAKRPFADAAPSRGSAPQGGVIASAGDLARYLQMMMNGEDDVLSAKGKAEMMRPASEASPFYGFGWFIDSAKGTVFHTGNSPGYETLATLVPAEKKGAVVLVNAGSGIGFGETAALRDGIAARALDQAYAGEGSRFWLKTLFVTLVLTPVIFLVSTIWAWRHRSALRAKSGAFGRFSLWFPLVTTLASAWIIFGLVPGMIGTSFDTLNMFQPDLGLTLIAIPLAGVLWALFRLGVAYSGHAPRPR